MRIIKLIAVILADGSVDKKRYTISFTEDERVVKRLVKEFNEFEDIKHTLDALREGYTIALVNIGPLKDKDIVELKRAVNKLKKTCDAINGDIAGFSEDWIVVTPSFAQVHRHVVEEKIKGTLEEL